MKELRLQVRVTQANIELLQHLERFEPEYRGKRLIALAAMKVEEFMKGELRSDAIDGPQGTDSVTATESAHTKKAVPTWISKTKQNG